MRKELYEKLNFEERTMYRIENNSIEMPEINFGMLTFGMLGSLIAVAVKSYSTALLIIKVTLIFTVGIYAIRFISLIVENSKLEKEWTQKVLSKK